MNFQVDRRLPARHGTRIRVVCIPLACLMLMMAQGCKSDKGSKKNKTIYYPIGLTEERTQTGYGQTTAKFSFTYEGSMHRIVSRKADFDPGMRSVYTYSAGGYTEDLYVNDSLAVKNIYTLNNLNLVDSLLSIDLRDDDSSSARFLYDANKNLVTQKQYGYTTGYGFLLLNSIAYTYDSTGNLLTAHDGYKTISYTYSSGNFNSLSLGQVYMQRSPTLPDMEVTVQSTGETASTGHIYTFDSDGRLISDESSQSDGTTIKSTYTY